MYIVLGKSTSKAGVYDFFKPSLKNTSTSTTTASVNPSTISTTNKTEQTISANPLASDKKPDEHLKGEEYIFLILRLLYTVSNSVICQKSLTTPKWLTLLLLLVGCGNFGVQRRLFRLLRRLLSKISPYGLKAYIPSMTDMHTDLLENEAPFDDEEIIYWMNDKSKENKLSCKIIF